MSPWLFLILATGCKKDNSSGNQTSPVQAPVLTTSTVTAITQTTASCGGNITSDGGATITSRGVCWNTKSVPTIVNSKTLDGTGIGTFTSSLTGLTDGLTYHVRSYATNSFGTRYGEDVVFSAITSSNPFTKIEYTGNTFLSESRHLLAAGAAGKKLFLPVGILQRGI